MPEQYLSKSPRIFWILRQSSRKMRKMSKHIERVKKSHILQFPPKFAACFVIWQLFGFCSFFRGSYLGTPEIQFETGSPSSNAVVKVPIDVIHVVNGSTGIDIFSCMSLQNVAGDTATGCILQCLKQVHILSQQRTQTILLYYFHRIWVKSYHRVQHV